MSTKRARALKFKRGSFPDPRQHFSKAQIADMHYVYGLCDGDARKAAREYQQRYPQRRAPTFRLFNEIHRRLRKHGIPQKREPRFSKVQVADMHYIFGFCNGDPHAAASEYKRRYPQRVTPTPEDFTLVHKRVRRHGTREQIEPMPELEEKEKAKVRSFLQSAYSKPSFRKILLGFGMHPLFMSELLKKGKPNQQLYHLLRSIKKRGIELSFRENDATSDNESDDESDDHSYDEWINNFDFNNSNYGDSSDEEDDLEDNIEEENNLDSNDEAENLPDTSQAERFRLRG